MSPAAAPTTPRTARSRPVDVRREAARLSGLPRVTDRSARRGEASAPRLRVLVADAQPVYREELAHAVKARPDFELVGIAVDLPAALALVDDLRPDVVLLGLGPGDEAGSALTAAVGERAPGTRVVLLTTRPAPEVVYAALAAGARGFLSKRAGRAMICDAIARVGRGGTFVADDTHEALARAVRRSEEHDGADLTPREHEILRLVAEGRNVPQIAQQLIVSQSTVKAHLAATYAKLGVSDRAAAVAAAMRRGILE